CAASHRVLVRGGLPPARAAPVRARRSGALVPPDAVSVKLSPVWRVTVHVPEAHVRRLIDGIRAVDDLRIGAYADVLWISAPGIEQFRPLEGAQPALGTIGERVRSTDVCVSFGIPRDEARLARLLD